jgi:hypothetical protein
MRWTLRLGAAAAVLLACAPAAYAARAYQVKPHTKTLYLRNKASGYVIGTAFAGQRVDVQLRARRNRWGYGAIYGELGAWAGARCGWFQLSGARPLAPKQTAPDLCPRRPRGIPETEIFMPGSYFAHVGTGAVYPAQVKLCADSGAYGNYDPAAGTFFSRYGDEPTGRGPTVPGFGIRYLTKDGKAAMIKDSSNPAGAPTWFFMHADCVAGLPVYVGELRHIGESWPLANRLVQPGVVEPYKGGRISRLHWRLWGASAAEARGRADLNTCEPACAYGNYIRRWGGRVKLHRRRLGTCDGQPAFYYTRATVHWPRLGAHRPRTDSFTLRHSCHPNLNPLDDDGECGPASTCEVKRQTGPSRR